MKTEKKYILISNLYPSSKFPYRGTFVKNFVDQMSSHGLNSVNQCVVNFSHNKIILALNYFHFIVKTVLVLVLKRDVNFIYVHYLNHSLIPLLLVQRWVKAPLFLNAHGGDILPESGFNHFLSRFASRVILNAKALVVPSKYFANIVAEKFGIDASRIVISPSGGVNLNIFSPNEKYTYDSKLLKILYVGRIEKDKGVYNFIKMCAYLKNKIGMKAEIVGSGSEFVNLKNEIKRNELHNAITLRPAISQNELVDYFRSSDIFLFPSLRKAESLGLVGLEAMACGMPVIGTKIAGISDYVVHHKNGYLTEEGDYKDMAGCILNFSSLSELSRADMRKAARETAEKYSSSRVGLELYNKILMNL